jgi:hypothetical protein
MWNGFIGKQIKRSNTNVLMSNLLLLSVPVAIGVLGANYWHNFFAGPAPLSASQISKFKGSDIPDRHYITVKGDEGFDTEVTEVTTTTRHGAVTNKEVSAKYVILKVADRALLVKAKPGNASDVQFTGELQPLPSDVQSHIIEPLVKAHPEAKEVFLPYVLDQEADYKGGGYFGLGIGIPAAAIAAWNLLRVGKRWGKPESHPIAKGLASAGEASMVAATIEQELPTSHKVGKTTITRNWLLQPTSYGLKTLQLGDLVWFYQKVTSHSTNGIPTGKTYSTVMYDRSGRNFEIKGKEQQVGEIMTILYDKAPWAVTGYSDELQKMWQKQRQDLIAAVDARRETGDDDRADDQQIQAA